MPENPVEFTVRPENPATSALPDMRFAQGLKLTVDAKRIERSTQDVVCGFY